METTRHFTATTYIVHDGATALHEHARLDMWLPPGGHIDRDELPRQAARREVYEETGLDVTLLESPAPIETPDVVELGRPAHLLLEDIHEYEDGTVGHQHVDFVYFGTVPSREIDPAGHDEQGDGDWEWFTTEDLREHPDLGAEVQAIGREAIDAVSHRI